MQDDENIDAFVVRRTDYYRKQWKKFHDKSGFALSFNWAAGLGQLVWLAYRKLYLPLFCAIAVGVVYVVLWIDVEQMLSVSGELSAAWSWFVSLLFFAVFGFFGNYWYWRKFRRVERQAASSGSDKDAQLRSIRAKGGTNSVVAWLVVVVFLMPIAWGLYWGVYQASRFDYSAYVLDATGPLTLAEVQANFFSFMDEPLDEKKQDCVFSEVEDRARAAGDPETLNPATIEFLPVNEWGRLDPSGKRIILTQAIVTKSLIVCNNPRRRATARVAPNADATGRKEVIIAGDPRFKVFELSNSAGDGTYATPDATVLLSFLARDARYCRVARFAAEQTAVLACRNEGGWEIEARSRLLPGNSTNTTVFGGGDMNDVTDAVQALKGSNDLLDEAKIIEAAGKGWR